MCMDKIEQRGYLAPEIEVNEVMVEMGFATSPNMENIGKENPDAEW